MKRLLTLLAFTMTLLFSTQNASAQNILEINAEADTQMKALRKVVKFEDSKMEDVYKAYQNYGIAYKKISNNLEANTERMEKINKVLDERLKEILTDEEYIAYLKYFRDR